MQNVLEEMMAVPLRDRVCGLPFFTSHSDLAAFERMELAAVYAIGPTSGRPLKVGWSIRPDKRFVQIQNANWHDLKAHEIAWTQGPPMAKRLEKEIHRILTKGGRLIRGEWFDVPVEMVVPTFDIAIRNLGIQTLTHAGMLERFEDRKRSSTLSAMRMTEGETLKRATRH